MSTRCNIHFCYADGTVAANIYRHCDGYPESEHGVLADLARFFDAVKAATADTRFGDPSYLAAKFVVWQADLCRRDQEGSPLDFLGVGVVSEDASDGEFVYEILATHSGLPSVRWRKSGGKRWKTGAPS